MRFLFSSVQKTRHCNVYFMRVCCSAKPTKAGNKEITPQYLQESIKASHNAIPAANTPFFPTFSYYKLINSGRLKSTFIKSSIINLYTHFTGSSAYSWFYPLLHMFRQTGTSYSIINIYHYTAAKNVFRTSLKSPPSSLQLQ